MATYFDSNAFGPNLPDSKEDRDLNIMFGCLDDYMNRDRLEIQIIVVLFVVCSKRNLPNPS